jgi:hypothetical protein
MYHLDAQTQTTLAREPRVRSPLFRGFRTLRRLQPGEH